jgi:hypothetical protein
MLGYLVYWVNNMNLEKRFWKKVDKTGQCWLWLGYKKETGYGRIRINNKLLRVHRVAWELTNGQIPKGLQVLHQCDTRNCVNPLHLFLGTHQDNMDDKLSKQRQVKGSACSLSKLDEEKVAAIKQLKQNGLTLRKIAETYKVNHKTIWHAIKGNTWKTELAT